MGESMWKKEISLGRKKPKQADAPEAVEAPTTPAPEQKQSLWKKDISLGRKQKEPKVEADAVEAEAKPSLWKKEVSFSRKKTDEEAVARLVELATKTVAPDFADAPPAGGGQRPAPRDFAARRTYYLNSC